MDFMRFSLLGFAYGFAVKMDKKTDSSRDDDRKKNIPMTTPKN